MKNIAVVPSNTITSIAMSRPRSAEASASTGAVLLVSGSELIDTSGGAGTTWGCGRRPGGLP